MRQPFFDDEPESKPVSNLGQKIRDMISSSDWASPTTGRSDRRWQGASCRSNKNIFQV
jgi:hypothetical protein